MIGAANGDAAGIGGWEALFSVCWVVSPLKKRRCLKRKGVVIGLWEWKEVRLILCGSSSTKAAAAINIWFCCKNSAFSRSNAAFSILNALSSLPPDLASWISPSSMFFRCL